MIKEHKMGKYSVPEEIRKYKPKGTMVKVISGNYYVYDYRSYTDENHKRKTKMGKIIGSIKEGVGFIPNNNYNVSEKITTLEYGQYKVALSCSLDILNLLKKYFNPLDATKIYVISLINFVNSFTPLTDIKKMYEMSYLSVKYPSLKLGFQSISKFYDSLGRKQQRVLDFEKNLINNSSKNIAIDGHAILCNSDLNELSEKGNKFIKTGTEQMNLLLAYDIKTQIPLLSRIYEGGTVDKISINDFLKETNFNDLLFIVDAGFYSNENIKLFIENNNQFIIPLSQNLKSYKKISSKNLTKSFVYKVKNKSTLIEYYEEVVNDNRIIYFKDMNLANLASVDYLNKVEDENYPNCTMSKYNQIKSSFGKIVLLTNSEDKTPEEIYKLYKKRWTIETFYNYFKNHANYNALHFNDYYKTQGLAFIMLVSSLIYIKLFDRIQNLNNKSVNDVLLDSRMLKINLRNNVWYITNCKLSQKSMFDKLGFKLDI